MSKLITLGGGCFWCIEASFRHVRGVNKAVSGYSGGDPKRITYKEVCSGTTGHAEVVQVDYNPQVIDTKKILEVFFALHNPTELNQQGNDVGTQYRSVVFYHDDEQKIVTQNIIAELTKDKVYGSKPIVTEVSKYETFYPAEDYHQDYYQNNPEQGYCKAVVRPKYEKFKKLFKDLYV